MEDTEVKDDKYQEDQVSPDTEDFEEGISDEDSDDSESDTPEDTSSDSSEDAEDIEVPDGEDTGSSDEIEVIIGEEDPEEVKFQKAPQWVRDLRKADREKTKRIRELEKKLESKESPAPIAADPGPMPTLKEADYDENVFNAKVKNWVEKKKEYELSVQQAKQEEDTRKAQWNKKVQKYEDAKVKLKVGNIEESESIVRNTLSNTQFGIIVNAADNPALMVFALGNNPKKLEELAKITDPVLFTYKASKVEAQLKVTSKPKPKPEKIVNGRSSAKSDSTLDRLRAKAEKTGDYTAVAAYKQKLKGKE